MQIATVVRDRSRLESRIEALETIVSSALTSRAESATSGENATVVTAEPCSNSPRRSPLSTSYNTTVASSQPTANVKTRPREDQAQSSRCSEETRGFAALDAVSLVVDFSGGADTRSRDTLGRAIYASKERRETRSDPFAVRRQLGGPRRWRK